MQIGHIIAKQREMTGISQNDLAAVLGASPSAVALWETNKRHPSLESLVMIADHFNVSMDVFLL